MKQVYLIETLRTPFGSFGGNLSSLSAPALASIVIRKLIEKSKIDTALISEVIIGQVLSGGSGQAPARQALRYASLADSTPAMTINKVCGSGLKACMLAADAIRLGRSEIVIAGGMESMSRAPYALPKARFGYKSGNGDLLDLMFHDALIDPYTNKPMGLITEEVIKEQNLTRGEQDEYTAESYQRAQAATIAGHFDREIVPVMVPSRHSEKIIDRDEEPYKVNFDKIPNLNPVFMKEGTITAANASTISDGAALTILASEEAVKKFQLTPVARMVAYTSVSIHPDHFSLAPVEAIRTVIKESGIPVDAIDRFEINEAFAAVPLLTIKHCGLDRDKVNVHGGALSLGHPVGASGGRLVATLVHEMARKTLRYGLATLCIGGGEAVAAIFERS